MKFPAFAGALLVLAFAAGTARADDPGTAGLDMTVIDCQPHNAAQESADMDLAAKAFDAISKANQTGGADQLTALNAMLPGLETALAHAPDKPSLPEHCGDTIVLYSDDMMQMLVLSAAVDKNKDMISKNGGATKVEQREPLPYALLAFAVGWIKFEQGDYAGADAADRKGLLNDPNDALLASEDSYALAKLGRSQEAYDAAAGFLAAHPGLDDANHALLLRREGYALIDLNRLDEAQAAYEQSLKLDPGNAAALGDLDYIKQQRASH